jgi:starch synthase
LIVNDADAVVDPPLTVVHAASEVVGFAKTGGLADVVGSLPAALTRRGHHCSIFLPLYRSARTGPIPLAPTPHTFQVPIGHRLVAGRVYQARLPDAGVPVYLIEQPDYYERDDPDQGRGLYQYTLPTGQKCDYADNCERFVFFCRAVLEALPLLGLWPDVLHLHDWQTGLIPVYLSEQYRKATEDELRDKYRRMRILFSIHNLAYQGVFWHLDMPLMGLDWRLFNYHQLEFYGHVNFLKAGIVFADLLSTVSPTYAREVQTPYYGCGLQGVLAERRQHLYGIVNGVDYRVWNPAIDPHLAAHYDADTVAEGKPSCKAALQRRCGLPETPRTPLIGMVSRLVDQKGLDLIGRSTNALLAQDVQLVVLGEGDPVYHRMLQEIQRRYPRQVAVTLGHDEPLAHQIEAGADLFLMSSQYEPCGLSQLYSLKYGTVPLVRTTGGLADTVVDANPQTLAAGTATGFSFVPYTPAALLETVQRAVELYRDEPERWLTLMQTGMCQDWSWNRSAAEYEKLYIRLRNDAEKMTRGLHRNP